jgi:threonine dehydrogenase-like Zn-dependent dehydrogenase
MRGLTFQGKQRLAVERLPDPRLEAPTDVIIKVETAGICGSDLHPYHEREAGLEHGTVMGHEVVGVVVEAGPGVRRLRAGQRVAVPFTTSCGWCYYCLTGLTCRCVHGQLFGWRQAGRGLQGLQAEYARIPLADATAMAVPEDIGLDEAVLLGDVLPTGLFCADLAECRPGGIYAVIGCGPIGLMAIAGALRGGADQVYALDSVPERLKLAARFGAVPLRAGEPETRSRIMDATTGRGVDAALECVGSPGAQSAAFDLVRPGGTLATVGVHTSAAFSFSPGAAYDKNLTYRVGRCPARAGMPRALEVVRSRRFPVAAAISHHLPLADGPRAYQLFDEKQDRCTKVVLTP